MLYPLPVMCYSIISFQFIISVFYLNLAKHLSKTSAWRLTNFMFECAWRCYEGHLRPLLWRPRIPTLVWENGTPLWRRLSLGDHDLLARGAWRRGASSEGRRRAPLSGDVTAAPRSWRYKLYPLRKYTVRTRGQGLHVSRPSTWLRGQGTILILLIWKVVRQPSDESDITVT